MQLLVSVRDATEARAAIAGGADVVDAKDPEAGPLGAVAPDTLRAICEAVPPGMPLSAALGDARSAGQVRRVIRGFRGIKLAFLKLGFAGVPDYEDVLGLLTQAVHAARDQPDAPGVIAVAYADWLRAGSLEPGALPDLAARSGAAGVLLDTAFKDEGRLLELWTLEEVATLVARIRAAGLVSAVAGGLLAEDLAAVAAVGPDIVGVRGAACDGGRTSLLSSERVRLLKAALCAPLVTPPAGPPRRRGSGPGGRSRPRQLPSR